MSKKLPKQFSPHIYQEWGELFTPLSDRQKAEILMAITMFPNYEPKDNPVWGFIKSQILKEFELFNERCQKNGDISRDYWNRMKSNDTERTPNDIDGHPKQEQEQEQEYKQEQELKEKCLKEKSNHPSIDDVKQYCLERHNSVDPEKWFDYYKSNGWKVGKNPMKDWKACVRLWEKNQKQKKPLSKYEEINKHNYEFLKKVYSQEDSDANNSVF